MEFARIYVNISYSKQYHLSNNTLPTLDFIGYIVPNQPIVHIIDNLKIKGKWKWKLEILFEAEKDRRLFGSAVKAASI